MSFKPTQNIDSAFRSMRMIMIVVVTGSLFVSFYALYQSAQVTAAAQDKMYVIAGDKAIAAFASSRRDNIGVEARDHVRTFHSLFFSLDPDEKAITATVRKALYLSDATAKKKYDDLVEAGYIAGVISGNVSQEIQADSVIVNFATMPYAFRFYGTEKIIRPTTVVTRTLITQGFLRNVARSDNNPHGFLIEKWEIVDNRDVKIENR